MRTHTFTLHIAPQQGETKDDVLARVLSAVHTPQIEAESWHHLRFGISDVIDLKLTGFANDAEVQDHVRRFNALGAHASVC